MTRTQDIHLAWIRFVCQCRYRNEICSITFDQWQEIWENCWHLRGRSSQSLCLSRKNWLKPWTKRNAVLMTRAEHVALKNKLAARDRAARGQKGYKKRC